MGAPTRVMERAAITLIALALAATVVGAQGAGQTITGLAGTWVLDQKASGGSEKAPGTEGRGGDRGGMGGLPGGFSFGGTSGLGASGPPDEAKIARQRRIAKAELAAPQRIVIEVVNGQLTVTVDDERPETLVPDGRKHLRLTGDGEVNTTTRWQDGVLVSERHYDEGITATRTYHAESPGGGGPQLVVTLKMDGGGLPRKMPELRRIYRRQP